MAKRVTKGHYHAVIRNELSNIEYNQGILSNIGENVPRISSGCLVNDLIMGGGIPPAMCTFSGHEGGGKTTLLNHSLCEGVKEKVDTIIHFDAENARDPEYVPQIYRGYDFREIYGVPGKKAGEWLVDPLVNYYPYNQFERVFGVFRAVLNILPDKVYRQEDDTWYYVFRNKKAEIARYKAMELKPEKGLSDRKRIWCPTDTVGIQAILACDSWASLVLEDEEEEENDKQGIAVEARTFSKRLRSTVGRLLRKQCILLGVNQLRTNPMAGRYGNPDYEPGGNALKFYSDIRNGLRPVVPRDGFVRDKDARGLAVEPSIYGKGNDRYAFKSISNLKNKYGRPLLRGMMRIWVSDRHGMAHGIDPVYDIYAYLQMTGQIDGSIKRGFIIEHKALKGIKLKWPDFKEIVLYQHFNDEKNEKKWFKKRKVRKKIKLREFCEEQLMSGKAIDLFNAAQASSNKYVEESDLESSG